MFEKQGGSDTTLYSANYNNQDVIVKVENKNANPERYDQSLTMLERTFHATPHIVHFFGYGYDWKGGKRFIVLERLYDLPKLITMSQMQEYVDIILDTSYLLYQHGLNWVAAKKHVLVNKAGVLKLIDFNDDNEKEESFFHRKEPSYDSLNLIESLFNDYNISSIVLDNAIVSFFERRYQKLKDVHQPVYFPKFNHFLRTESEENDPNYGKLVPPNRKCTDRAEMLNRVNFQSKTYLDIGCNVGFFCFYAIDRGAKRVVGLDRDQEKIDFNRTLCDYVSSPVKFSYADVTPEYVKKMESYDVISLFSILHLYFTQHKVSFEYWKRLVTGICKKVNDVLIIETSPVIFQYLPNISNWEEFRNMVKGWGNFSSVEEIGVSDTNSHRPVLVFKK